MKKYPIVPKHPSPDDFEIGRRKVLGLKKEGYGEVKMTESEYVKCPNCKGTGKVIICYRNPPRQNEYFICWMCSGKGMLKKELLKELEGG